MRHPGAQRPRASLIQARCGSGVTLSALVECSTARVASLRFRHNATGAFDAFPVRQCSTPEGVTDSGTPSGTDPRKDPWTCSTPEGVTDSGTFMAAGPAIISWSCSTPEGVTDSGTPQQTWNSWENSECAQRPRASLIQAQPHAINSGICRDVLNARSGVTDSGTSRPVLIVSPLMVCSTPEGVTDSGTL